MTFEKIIGTKNAKRLFCAVIAAIATASAISANCNGIMHDISKNVVRFHILANSDLPKDQQMKLQIRDDVSAYISKIVKNCKSAQESGEAITENLENIELFTKNCLKKHGCTYSATVSFGNYKFPRREYENATLPGGNYNALKIVLGKGNGRNWWCILYPQLCFSEAENGNITEKGFSELKEKLTDEEYSLITSKGKVKFKLKILELFSNR